MQEIPADQIDKSTAYMLFYEREDLNFEEYLPDITEKNAPDTKDLDEELETDFKKQCSIMWEKQTGILNADPRINYYN